jgi:hypothetical protein
MPDVIPETSATTGPAPAEESTPADSSLPAEAETTTPETPALAGGEPVAVPAPAPVAPFDPDVTAHVPGPVEAPAGDPSSAPATAGHLGRVESKIDSVGTTLESVLSHLSALEEIVARFAPAIPGVGTEVAAVDTVAEGATATAAAVAPEVVQEVRDGVAKLGEFVDRVESALEGTTIGKLLLKKI